MLISLNIMTKDPGSSGACDSLSALGVRQRFTLSGFEEGASTAVQERDQLESFVSRPWVFECGRSS